MTNEIKKIASSLVKDIINIHEMSCKRTVSGNITFTVGMDANQFYLLSIELNKISEKRSEKSISSFSLFVGHDSHKVIFGNTELCIFITNDN